MSGSDPFHQFKQRREIMYNNIHEFFDVPASVLAESAPAAPFVVSAGRSSPISLASSQVRLMAAVPRAPVHYAPSRAPSRAPSTAEPGELDTLDQNAVIAQRRMEALMEELRFTEKTYCSKLRRLVRECLPGLGSAGGSGGAGGAGGAGGVFSCAEELYGLHSRELLPALCLARDVAAVAEVFISRKSKFTIYAKYYENAERSTDLTQAYKQYCRSEERKEGKERKERPASPGAAGAESLLAEPVYQLPRYLKLLRKMLTVAASPADVDALRAALAVLGGALKLFREAAVLETLKDCPVNLRDRGKMLRQREFYVSRPNKPRCTMTCFLFEKLFLFASMSSKGSYRYKHAIEMEELGLTSPTGEQPGAFRVWSHARTIVEYKVEGHPDDIALWAGDVAELLWKQARQQKETLQRMHTLNRRKEAVARLMSDAVESTEIAYQIRSTMWQRSSVPSAASATAPAPVAASVPEEPSENPSLLRRVPSGVRILTEKLSRTFRN